MSRLAALLGALSLVTACDSGPPHDVSGARGVLDDGDYFCTIYPSDGYASIQIGGDYWMDVSLPPLPDRWDRGGASLVYGPDISCPWIVGTSGTRVQYGGEPVPDPDCDGCSSRYRALYLEGLYFGGGEACDCLGDCRTFGETYADRWYVWCDSPDDFAP